MTGGTDDTEQRFEKHVALLRDFIEGRMTVDEFEHRFLALYHPDDPIEPGARHRAVHDLFVELGIDRPGEIDGADEETLRELARRALARHARD